MDDIKLAGKKQNLTQCGKANDSFQIDDWVSSDLCDSTNSVRKFYLEYSSVCLVCWVNLERRCSGRRHWGIGKDGRVRNPSSKNQYKRSNDAMKVWTLYIPVADGTAKLSGRAFEFREPTPRREQLVRSEDFSWELQGESGESQPTESTDDAEDHAKRAAARKPTRFGVIRILGNAIAFCEMSKTSWKMGKLSMKGDSENHRGTRSGHSRRNLGERVRFCHGTTELQHLISQPCFGGSKGLRQGDRQGWVKWAAAHPGQDRRLPSVATHSRL